MAGNEQVCESKLNHDVYVPLNNFSCQDDDILDFKSSVIERYKSTRKPSISNFNTAGILSLAITLLIAAESQHQSHLSLSF